MKTKLTPLICIALILSLSLFAGGVVGAEENLTVFNPVNGTNSTEIEPLEDVEIAPPMYRNTEQYQSDYAYWYDFYTKDRETGYEATLRAKLKEYMENTALSDSERWDGMLITMGYDFRLENYLNAEKRTIDEETGKITYDLGVGNWWANLFNSGVDESKLPQTIAEGQALLDIYHENYRQYFGLMVEEGTE